MVQWMAQGMALWRIAGVYLTRGAEVLTRMERQQERPEGLPLYCMHEPKRPLTDLFFQQDFSLLRVCPGTMASCCLFPSTGRQSPSFSEFQGSLLSCPLWMNYIELPQQSKLAVLQEQNPVICISVLLPTTVQHPPHSRGKNKRTKNLMVMIKKDQGCCKLTQQATWIQLPKRTFYDWLKLDLQSFYECAVGQDLDTVDWIPRDRERTAGLETQKVTGEKQRH